MRETGSRIGFDIGGTFTDIVFFDAAEGAYKSMKVSSTPSDPSVGAVNGIRRALSESERSGGQVAFLSHGTTVGTNAVLEGKLARTALITTEGFRDVLEIGRQRRPDQYSFFAEKASVLVPRSLRFTLRERVNHKGEVVRTIDEAEIGRLAERLLEERVESVAVSFLFSFLNPQHERVLGEALRERLPEAYVFLSSDLLPEYREYERTSTLCLNAAVAPVVTRYVEHLEQRIESELGIGCGMNVMKSSGGIMPSTAIHKRAVETVLSGPAAGAIAVAHLGEIAGYRNLIGFDMGGTSTDISVVVDGLPRMTSEGTIGGYPFRLPIVDINTIGAGGGSIGWIDVAKGLHVGPMSAGADPGPVCYGKGGEAPTVTDANLCLRRINEDFFLGGDMDLDKEASEAAVREMIGAPFQKDLARACQGILEVANANMIRAIRVSSMERGLDPREFTLMAFGGAGPLHAADLAEELGISTIIVPEMAGVLSAKGLLVSDIKNDYSVTQISRVHETDSREFSAGLEGLRERAIQEYRKDRIPTSRMLFSYSVDMRYTGQAYEITVPFDGQVGSSFREDLAHSFHRAHKQLYWWNDLARTIEIVTLRISAISEVPKIRPRPEEPAGTDPKSALLGTRRVYFGSAGDFLETKVYRREALKCGNVVEGPSILESKDTTVVVSPRYVAETDGYRNTILKARSG